MPAVFKNASAGNHLGASGLYRTLVKDFLSQ
jgi:hypothetical protein